MQSAYRFAEQAHRGQTRRSGEAYISHPLAVARILAGLKVDVYCLCAALLHDVIEDCDVDNVELTRTFGPLVGQLVNGLSKLQPVENASPAERRTQSLRKLLTAIIRDKRVVLIKLADRLHNVYTLRHMSRPTQIRVARETLDIYAQLARRLGMYNFYRDLADESFATLHPLRHSVIQRQIERQSEQSKQVEERLRDQLGRAFANANIAIEFQQLPFSLYSYYSHWRNGDQRLEALTGGARMMLLADNEEDCYRALWQAHRLFTPRQRDLRDFIAVPKSNGYRSLHTQVSVGGKWSLLVIRDRSMDRIASVGAISSLKTHSADFKGELRRLVEEDPSANFADSVRDDLRVRRVLAFTPDGKRVELPSGATALDFAFALDRQMGLKAVGCELDGQKAPLTTVIQGGNRVQIECGTKISVQPEWLHSATTRLARQEIRRVLARQHSQDARQIGQRMLVDCLERLGQTLQQVQSRLDFADRLNEAGVDSLDGLLLQIGTGKRLAAPLAAILAGSSEGKSELKQSSTISGAEGLPVQFASCCYPLPGDSIVGTIRPGKGFSVHRHSCRWMREKARPGSPPMALEWADQPQGPFTAVLRLDTDYRHGVLANITRTISQQGIDILNLQTNPKDKSIHIELTVSDCQQMQKLLRRLRTTVGVHQVKRSDNTQQPSAADFPI